MQAALAKNEKPNYGRFKSSDAGIVAPLLVNDGDYYLKPNGDKVWFYRKKDVYAISLKKNALVKSKRSSISTITRYQAQYGSRVKQVKNHKLGANNIIRLDNGSTSVKTKSKANTGFEIEPSMLKALDSSVDQLQPILANSKGNGDILIGASFLIKLRNESGVNEILISLSNRYNIEIVRKLKTVGAVYLVTAADGLNTSQRFALTRNVMNDAEVLWTQPLFKSKPYKTSFEPNDPLFAKQWNLRNTGQGGSRCDTDCDANNAWGIGAANGFAGSTALAGDNMVIAIVDDGVQLVHEDLRIWTNLGESGPDGNGGFKETNGIDDDGNGCIDDVHGCDFVDDQFSPLLNPSAILDDVGGVDGCKTLLTAGGPESTPSDSNGQMCRCQDSDGTLGPDGDPSPQTDSLCLTFDDEVVAEQDNHGTAVAGIAAARGNNAKGIAGVAYESEILPVRLISSFDNNATSNPFCARAVEALTYAARHADVINNSWGLDEGTCDTVLEDLFANIVDGTLMNGGANISKRPNLGSPLVFASGNSASGWVKITVPVSTAGEHAYEWRFLRTDDDLSFDDFTEDDSAWVDDIVFPGGDVENFNTATNITNATGFSTACDLNRCNDFCETGDNVPCATWEINADPNYSRSGKSAKISQAGNICNYSYLHTIKDGPAGEISFWVWVSSDLQNGSDNFEFLVDGAEVVSFADFPKVVDNAVGYPANITVERGMGGPREALVISVGASDSGDLSNISTRGLQFEERAAYSQFGATLDILAPSSNQHLAVHTTDRYGASNSGYNSSRSLGIGLVNGPKYTEDFGGTSAAAPVVSGIAAAIIAKTPTLSALDVENKLKSSADKIGRRGSAAYGTSTPQGSRSDFYGHGRVNMFKALDGGADPSAACVVDTPTYSRLTDLFITNYQSVFQCSALGPLIERIDDDICFPVKAENGKFATVCL